MFVTSLCIERKIFVEFFLPNDVVSRAWMEVKLCVNPSTLMSQVRGLNTQVLSVFSVLGDPAQEPVVALISAGDLQSYHVVPAEEDHSHLSTFSGQGQCGSNTN